VAINYRYEKGVSYDVSCGRRRQIDSQQVRLHIERLLAHGWSRLRIAQTASISPSTVYGLAAGQREVRRHIALAILSIPVGPPRITVDATGATRRIQALVAIGHTMETIAGLAHFGHARVEQLAAGTTETIDAATADTITAVYRQLLPKPGSSRLAKAYARKRGWHGPLAWDDIDDPACRPDDNGAYNPADKYRRDPDRIREIEHLYLLGESVPSIAKQLGGNEKYISDQLTEIIRKRAERAEAERLAARRTATQQLAA
jgi:DNA-binding CsgD family transcriptional regulator